MDVAKSIPKDFPFCTGNDRNQCVRRVRRVRKIVIIVCIVIIVLIILLSPKHHNLKSVQYDDKIYQTNRTGFGTYDLLIDGIKKGTIVNHTNNYMYTITIDTLPPVDMYFKRPTYNKYIPLF